MAKLLFTALLALFLLAVPGAAAAPPASAPTHEAIIDSENKWPMVPGQPGEISKPFKAEIYQHESSPLGDRTPVVMLHGGGGEMRPFFRMDRIADALSNNQEFAKKFKVFYLRYDASTVLEESVPQVVNAIKDFKKLTGKSIVAIGYSLGGNALQRALLDPEVNDDVSLVISMGAPLRGSPLFCNDWYEYSLHKNHWHFWNNLFRTHTRRMYFSRHRHLLRDLRWDNADGHIPEVGIFRSDIPFGPSGNLTVEGSSNEKLAAINNEGPLTKTKFITYAAYIRNPYMLARPLRQLVLVLEVPYDFIVTHLPLFLGEEHAALRILNRDIGRVHVHPQGPSRSATSMPYLLNDGLAPVTSCILLSPDAFREFPAVRPKDLPKLNEWLDVRLARVFCDIDHISFAEGKPPHMGLAVKDQMHPHEHRHSLYEWLLRDLLDFAASQK